jgi:amino acid adenylation domain-containing protein
MQQDYEAAREFWTQALCGYSTPLALSIDRGHAEIRGGQGKNVHRKHQVSLSEAETQALRGFARRHGLTLSTVIQGAWAILLSRYGRQKDVVFGATVSGRASGILGIETMVGLCINTVPVRARVDGRKLVEWLQDLQAFNANALQYEYAALADIHSWSEIPQDQPFFESILVFENYPFDDASLQGGGIALKLPGLYGETEYPLGLGVDMGPRFVIEIAHDVRRYDSDAITRMMTHLFTILSDMVSRSEWRISELGMLAEQERRQILEQWNATAWEYERELSIAALFEAQVERDPEATAVVFEGKSLSYGELNERANQLGWYLRQQGIGPESRVGICLERSLDMVVSLLAVLKAGAAYVPLDAEYPAERLAFMAEDAGVSALISKSTLLEGLPVAKSRLLCLEAEAEAIGQHSNSNLPHETRADNLAYIIYTSGSTGKPKGAMNTQGGLCNRLMWMQRMYRLEAEDRVLQKTPFSFDVSVWEFFWPLLWGARLVMARPGGHRDRDYLVEVIEGEGITTLHFVPSMLRQFLGASGLERCRSVKRVICSGEALPYEVAREFFKHFTAELHNLYGPTEAAIDVTYWRCEREMSEGVIPIGKPIANTQMYVLEENLEPAPVGVLGDIYIGGDGLGRGYWKQAGMTAERFVPNPFGRGERMYRTGDVGRWREDGNLEYAGRSDNQVKVRGYRIELGEIEAALKRQAGVREAVVEVREDAPGDKRLVAYIVGAETVVTGLREALRQNLPEYMVPSSFMVLEELPLTPNGKLDRRALPAPGPRRPELEKSFEGPRNEVEEVLATMWGDLLRAKQPGIHDNFFELGGHSLLLMQLASRIHCEFGANVPLRLLFDDPTIAGMTDAIACVQAEGEDKQELAALLSQLGNTTPLGRATSAQ